MDPSDKNPGEGSWLRGVLLSVSALALLCFGVPTAFYVSMDHKNEPHCHKAALMQVLNWLDEEHTADLPNVEGRSVDSLSKLNQRLEKVVISDWNARYQFVPGLRRGDPGDSVLLYLKGPTRYLWHANPRSIFSDAKWMIVPLDFTGDGLNANGKVREVTDETGENSEQVSFEDFKSRLRKTLKFLQDNDRPNWQTVVAENEAFLKSIEYQ